MLLKFLDGEWTSRRRLVYLLGEEAVSDMNVEVLAFGFGCQELGIALLRNVKILPELARAKFHLEQAQFGLIQERSQHGRFHRYPVHSDRFRGFSPVFRILSREAATERTTKKQNIIKMF